MRLCRAHRTWGRTLLMVVGGCVAAGCHGKVTGGASVSAQDGVNVGLEGDARADLPMVRFRLDGQQLTYEGPGEVSFATDSARLVGEQTFATMDALAEFLLAHPEVKLRIEGHTDSRGSRRYNRRLSEGRAHAVLEYLVDKGVAEDRLEHEGLGEDRPKVPEPEACRDQTTEAAPEECEARYWRANRRTELHVTEGSESIVEGPGRETSADPPAEGWFRGWYVYGAPGIVAVPIGPERSYRKTSYQWGVGAGYLFAPRRRLRVGLGLGFEHAPMIVTANGVCDAGGLSDTCRGMHDLRLNLELRLGAAGERVFGYGVFGPGVALGITDTEVWGGFEWPLGAGLWGRVWRGLFLGGEAGVDLMVFAGGPGDPYNGGVFNFELKLLVGWHTGWRERRR